MTHEIVAGLRRWRFWVPMGLLDVRLRYRRTVAGPWWAVAGTVVMAVVVGSLYARLFDADPRAFIPFVATGFAGWSLIASHLSEAPTSLVARGSLVADQRGVAVPLLLADGMRRIVMFGHAALGVALLVWALDGRPSAALLLLVPNAILVAAALTAWSIVLAYLGALYRDVHEAVALALVPLLLVTPVLWRPEQFGLDPWWVRLNPLASLLDLLRAPILGMVPGAASYWIALAVLTSGAAAASLATAMGRRHVSIWVA